MTDRARNIAVGLTVIVGFCMLGALIILFAGMPQLFQTGYVVYIKADAANGIAAGDPVHLRGIRVGYITDVKFTGGKPGEGVTYTAKISRGTHMPGNVRCVIATGGIGRAFLDFWPIDMPKIKDPVTGKPLDDLENASAPVTVESEAKSNGLIPESLSKKLESALDNLASLAGNLNNMIAPPPAKGPATTGPSTTTGPASALPEGMAGLTTRLGRTLDALYDVIGDRQNQANIKESLANLNKATAGAIETMDAVKKLAANADNTFHDVSNLTTRASDDIHTLSQKLVTDAEDISKLMTSLNKASMALNSKEGSAGKFINDPALYESLLDVSKGMSTLVKDLDALVKQWKEQGVNMKLK